MVVPYDERDEDTGKLEQSYTDEEFLQAVREHEPAGTREIAAELGCHINLARQRLRQLVDENRVEEKKIGRELAFSTLTD